MIQEVSSGCNCLLLKQSLIQRLGKRCARACVKACDCGVSDNPDLPVCSPAVLKARKGRMPAVASPVAPLAESTAAEDVAASAESAPSTESTAAGDVAASAESAVAAESSKLT